jgi:hypothetical protein
VGVAAFRGAFEARLMGDGRGLVSTSGTPKRAARFLRFSSSSSTTATLSAGSVAGVATGAAAGAGAGAGFFGDDALNFCGQNGKIYDSHRFNRNFGRRLRRFG